MYCVGVRRVVTSKLFIFFFKQKTAYELRISDWSSDVCSSDLDPDVVQLALRDVGLPEDTLEGVERQGALTLGARVQFRHPVLRSLSYQRASPAEIGRASCRARVYKYV